jgi:glutamate synthase (NADPH) small chain
LILIGQSRPAIGQAILPTMGYVHPAHEHQSKTPGADLDPRGNVRAPTPPRTRLRFSKVFSAGDMRRGQSLVVWEIREGRFCARAIDRFLMGTKNLPREFSDFCRQIL